MLLKVPIYNPPKTINKMSSTKKVAQIVDFIKDEPSKNV